MDGLAGRASSRNNGGANMTKQRDECTARMEQRAPGCLENTGALSSNYTATATAIAERE